MINKGIRGIIRLYQLSLSPMISVGFGINCRYEETCSVFTIRMVREKGVILGLMSGIHRFCKCSGFTPQRPTEHESLHNGD